MREVPAIAEGEPAAVLRQKKCNGVGDGNWLAWRLAVGGFQREMCKWKGVYAGQMSEHEFSMDVKNEA